MNVSISEEQGMLQDSVRKFVQNEVPLTRVRTLAAEPKGLNDELWTRIAEQGWLGILIPEAPGGLGMGVQELAVVCEELGRGAVPGPFVSTVLVAKLIAESGNDAAKAAWLEKLASGLTRGALALFEESHEIDLSAIATKAIGSNGGLLLNGKKQIVGDAQAANLFAVAARNDDGRLVFCLVEADAPGVTVKPNKLADLTSRSGNVTFKNVQVSKDAVITKCAEDAYRKMLNVANICIAADCVGGADYIHKLTVAYVKERTQFGKQVGSFQAVRHPLVDMFAELEAAKSATYYSAWALDANSPDADAAVAIARNTATQSYRNVTNGCLQAHGGIGFTWEYDLHIFLKRAKHNQHLHGSSHDYDEIICKKALGI
ncbi:MAG: acyl-CoA/acyl-ACP dehydrogenase [Chloroflexi bacterium]|nr:acyl-CoA/acyl-ACP dehydrogenase [Chloroflexota bacterium]